MLEANLEKAQLFKKILDAIKELVENANFECTPEGVQVQAMDTSHVTLVSLVLLADGFKGFRCDRPMSLGVNIESMSKILKCADNTDGMVMRAADDRDELSFMFQAEKRSRMSVFDMKLMEIEAEPLMIPDQKYTCVVKMPSAEFQRICRDLKEFGDYVEIAVTKDNVTFSVSGDSGSGQVRLSPTSAVDAKDDEKTVILCEQPVTLSFALRYLCNFTRATALSNTVSLSMFSQEVPLVLEYPFAEQHGFIKYYLAAKYDDDQAASAPPPQPMQTDDLDIKGEVKGEVKNE